MGDTRTPGSLRSTPPAQRASAHPRSGGSGVAGLLIAALMGGIARVVTLPAASRVLFLSFLLSLRPLRLRVSAVIVPYAKKGVSQASGSSRPKPGASLGTSQPSCGIAWPGSPQPSASGTPGGVPTKHSSQGTAGVA
jgi:hypothetical protein